MADDIELNSGSGGAVVAADDIAGVHHQRVKIQIGDAGAAADVHTGNPLPISDAGGAITVDGTVAVTDGGGSLTVDGTVTVQDGGGALSIDDNGGSLTVDGTVTANVGTTGGLALDATLTGGSLKAIARGAAKGGTAAADATVSSVDADHSALDVYIRGGAAEGGGGDGAIVDGVSAAIKATVLDFANANPLAVRLSDTNGDYVAAGGGTQYTEDAAAAGDPVGNALIVRRRDALSTETTTDGDNTALNGTGKGELYVKHVDAIPVTDNGSTLSIDDGAGSITVDGSVTVADGGGSITVDAASLPLPTGASTLAEQQAQTTALQLLDDTVHATDAALGKSIAIGGHFDDASMLTVAENNVAPVRITPERSLHVELRSGTGEIGVSGTPLRVDPTGTTAQPVTDNGASLTVDNAALSVVGGGAEATALRVTLANDSTGVVSVDDNGGSLTVDGTVTAAGGAAHDAPVAGNPNLVAGRASAAAPADVSGDGDAVSAWHLRNGAQATVLTAAGALIGGDATNGLDVDITRLPALVAGTANIGDVDVLTVPAPLSTTGGGTEATALRVTVATDSTGVLSVDDNGGTLTVDDGGSSLTIDGTVTASNTAGDVAHDSGDSGNPVKVGGKAANAFPTAVANGDRANMLTDLFGRALVSHVDPAQILSVNKTYTSAQTGTDVIDPTAGKRIAILAVILGAYGTTAGRCILWFGDNADTTFTQDTDQVLVAASFAPSTTSKPGLVFAPPVPVVCNTADRELHITTDAALSIDVTVYYYEF